MDTKPLSQLKVALIYDRVNKWGGAERLLLALHRIFPHAPLYTSVYAPDSAKWAADFNVISSFIQKIPFLKNHHELIPFLMPFAFESFDFSAFDLVISITSAEAKGIITPPATFHLCLCLTPTRYLWVMQPDTFYQNFGFLNFIAKLLKSPLIKLLKSWDMVAKTRPDAYIAISGLVKSRLKDIYNVDAPVVYPPLDIGTVAALSLRQSKLSTNDSDNFLIVSRLVGYKRIDLAIRVANNFSLPLIIVGTGLEYKNLKKIAGPTVKFLGFVPDERLPQIYAQSKALLVPGEEEFCLSALEAQANGIPVIAYAHSGVAEIIIEGKTGLLFSHQTEESLSSSIVKFSTMNFDKAKSKANSDRFSFTEFQKSLTIQISILKKTYEKKLVF